MFFNDVIGQHTCKRQLLQSVHDNRISHAQLFLGPEGCGNLAMALAYSQYIVCENRTDTDSCGICPACIKAQKFIHPDIHFTFPFVNIEKRELCSDWITEWRTFLGKNPYGNYNDWIREIDAENKQGNIYAKECMDIMRRLTLKSFESPYKILILWLPEYLGNDGNRLLKIFEEPPDNTVFLLVATDQEKILNTILSRVQIIKFGRLAEKEIAAALQEELSLDEQKALRIASVSEGNYNEALAIASMQENEHAGLLHDWINYASRREIKDLITWNDQFARLGREYQKSFFQYALHFLREILLIQLGVAEMTRMDEQDRKLAEALAKVLDHESIVDLITLFEKSVYFIERNVNAKVMITYVSISLMKRFTKNKTISKQPFFEKWEF